MKRALARMSLGWKKPASIYKATEHPRQIEEDEKRCGELPHRLKQGEKSQARCHRESQEEPLKYFHGAVGSALASDRKDRKSALRIVAVKAECFHAVAIDH